MKVYVYNFQKNVIQRVESTSCFHSTGSRAAIHLQAAIVTLEQF